jgi:hypothetical protein
MNRFSLLIVFLSSIAFVSAAPPPKATPDPSVHTQHDFKVAAKNIQFPVKEDRDVSVHTSDLKNLPDIHKPHLNNLAHNGIIMKINSMPSINNIEERSNSEFSGSDRSVINSQLPNNNNELYDTIYQQKILIESLESQIKALTVTEETLSTLVTNVRSSCQADFQIFCQQNQLPFDSYLVSESEKSYYSDYFPSWGYESEYPIVSIPEAISNGGQLENNHESHDHSKDTHDSHDGHNQDSHDSHDGHNQDSHNQNHGHDNHGHHGHRKQFKARNLRSLHSLEKDSQPRQLGFGSSGNDQCMMLHFLELSGNCQLSINQKIEAEAKYQFQHEATVDEDDEHNGCHGALIGVLLIVFVVFACAVRRHRKRFLKMKKFVDVLYDNAEIRSVVEGIVGEPLPPRCQPCNGKSKKCVFVKRVFAVWSLSSIVVALFYLAFGTPIDIILTGILSSFIQLVVLIIAISIIVKLFKCCYKCFCKRNNSNNQTPNNNIEASEYPGQNRMLIQPIIFNPNSIPFQYQPIPTNHSVNEHAPFNSRNENIEMAYAGIPIQPNNA